MGCGVSRKVWKSPQAAQWLPISETYLLQGFCFSSQIIPECLSTGQKRKRMEEKLVSADTQQKPI